MRYYNLCIYSPPTPNPLAVKKGVMLPPQPILQFSSTTAPKRPGTPQRMPGGSPIDPYDPGALDISFNFSQADLAKADGPTGGAFVTISGIDISTINQASNLVGHTLILKAGMGKGLPLSNPNQAGIILHGTIQSSLGNWADKDMNITFFVSTHQTPPPYREEKAHILHCQKGQNQRNGNNHISTKFPNAF